MDIKYGLLYEAFDINTIKKSLVDQPAKIGNCLGYVPNEGSNLGYKFKVDFDQKDDDGNYCYVSASSFEQVV